MTKVKEVCLPYLVYKSSYDLARGVKVLSEPGTR